MIMSVKDIDKLIERVRRIELFLAFIAGAQILTVGKTALDWFK